jgi:hypothetical protein
MTQSYRALYKKGSQLPFYKKMAAFFSFRMAGNMKIKLNLFLSLFTFCLALVGVSFVMLAWFVTSEHVYNDDISIEVKGFDAEVELMYYNPSTKTFDSVDSLYNSTLESALYQSLVPGDVICFCIKVTSTSDAPTNYSLRISDYEIYKMISSNNTKRNELLATASLLAGAETNENHTYLSNSFRLSVSQTNTESTALQLAIATTDYLDDSGKGIGEVLSRVENDKTYSNLNELVYSSVDGVKKNNDNYWIVKMYYDPILQDQYVNSSEIQMIRLSSFQIVAS